MSCGRLRWGRRLREVPRRSAGRLRYLLAARADGLCFFWPGHDRRPIDYRHEHNPRRTLLTAGSTLTTRTTPRWRPQQRTREPEYGRSHRHIASALLGCCPRHDHCRRRREACGCPRHRQGSRANQRGEGYIEGGGYIVTWAIGHLVALAQPHQIKPEWKRWQLDCLPMLPTSWPLEIVAETRDQFEVVRKILRSRPVDGVIAATDAGREGELHLSLRLRSSGLHEAGPRRLWISSLTPDAIRDGFTRLRDGRAFDHLADAARGRSRADWLVGLNLSRAYTLTSEQPGSGELLSVGRVQDPHARNGRRAREGHPTLCARGLPSKSSRRSYQTDKSLPDRTAALGFCTEGSPARQQRRLKIDGEEAQHVVARVKRGSASIESIERQTRRLQPPLLYDLTELQRHANRPLWSQCADHAQRCPAAIRREEADQLSAYGQPTSHRRGRPDVGRRGARDPRSG